MCSKRCQALERLAAAAQVYVEVAFETPLDSQAALDRVDYQRAELLAALRTLQQIGRPAS